MTDDRLAQVADRLDALDAADVATHPDVLDAVHRALVDELDRLAGVVAGDGRGGNGRDPRAPE